jgi:hypothetical protein
MCPILDEQGEAFDADVNLNDLKTKKLGAEPDEGFVRIHNAIVWLR